VFPFSHIEISPKVKYLSHAAGATHYVEIKIDSIAHELRRVPVVLHRSDKDFGLRICRDATTVSAPTMA